MASKTEMFRQHHSDVRALVARIEELLDPRAVVTDAQPVASVVRELFGKFGIHLAIEDANLYPRMMAHADPRLKHTAARFQNEMGSLKTRFDDYRGRWPGPHAISRAPQAFVAETHEIVTALKRRIEREDAELYDLYDRA